MKFYGNPSNGVAVLYADGQTKMAKLIVAFRNSYAKSAKIQSIIELWHMNVNVSYSSASTPTLV